MIKYNSRDESYKNPFGAVKFGKTICFRIEIADGLYGTTFENAEKAFLVIKKEEAIYRTIEGNRNDEKSFLFDLTGIAVGLYFYNFEVYYKNDELEATALHQLTVYEANDEEIPKWLQSGVMYQIFPDRFKRSKKYRIPEQNKDYILHKNWGEEPICGPDKDGIVKNNDFFGGNIQGIIDELPSLNKLGVTVIYLNPIFKAYSNHRYDTGNYMEIDPLLGTTEDFVNLCNRAKALGMRIIIDGVFNHTGADSLYFNKYGSYDSIGAFQSKESPYYNWYHFDEYPYKYSSWWGIDTLPAINESLPDYIDYIAKGNDSVIKHWLCKGASGIRLDVADELPDEFLEEIRLATKEAQPDAAIIGEVWEDASNKVAYGKRRKYFLGKQVDSVMNYPLKDAIITYLQYDQDGEAFAEKIWSLLENYPPHIFNSLMNILGTHDTERIFSVFENGSKSYEEARQKFFLAIIIWAYMPGIPCIYYGDELGMKGGRDPLNRRCYEPKKSNSEINVFYKRILNFRNNIKDIGKLQLKKICGKKSYFSFSRENGNEKLVVAVNMNKKRELVDLDVLGTEEIVDVVISGDVKYLGKGKFQVEHDSGFAVYIKIIEKKT